MKKALPYIFYSFSITIIIFITCIVVKETPTKHVIVESDLESIQSSLNSDLMRVMKTELDEMVTSQSLPSSMSERFNARNERIKQWCLKRNGNFPTDLNWTDFYRNAMSRPYAEDKRLLACIFLLRNDDLIDVLIYYLCT